MFQFLDKKKSFISRTYVLLDAVSLSLLCILLSTNNVSKNCTVMRTKNPVLTNIVSPSLHLLPPLTVYVDCGEKYKAQMQFILINWYGMNLYILLFSDFYYVTFEM